MKTDKTTFVLFLGNRGTFPASLIQQAREEMCSSLTELGYQVLVPPSNLTPSGAFETPTEGKLFADFLDVNRGKYQGVILCLPNFGSEGGVIEALKNVQVPLLVQAYPDEMNKLSTATRRDAFCGKFAILNILAQYGLKFTNLQPHVVHPNDPVFKENIIHFDRICRVVNKLKNLTIGAIGARTTPFKSVRYDEIALQQHGITIETLDLVNVFMQFDRVETDSKEFLKKEIYLKNYTRWDGVPQQAITDIAKLGVAFDQIAAEYGLDGMALRCWSELQQKLGISPCVLMGIMNDNDMMAACEVDVCSAVVMAALHAVTGQAVTNLDWNNNYGNEKDKCILFHCGPVPQSLMKGKGQVVDHELLVPSLGKDCSWGCNVGRIKAMEMTYCGMKTMNGKLQFYIGEGKITEDVIPANFFGCAGVAQIENLQLVLQTIGTAGHRHHTVIVEGHVADAVHEALEKYIGAEVIRL
jgi:L-fucose isomerase-like protein